MEEQNGELVPADVVPADDSRAKAASLTGDLLMRGRSRARDLVQPPRPSKLRPPAPPGVEEPGTGESATTLPGTGLRDAGMLMIWVSVFLATFLIGLTLID